MDPSKATVNETLELTCQPQIELQLHSTNQNGELREAIKEDGVQTRRTMEEFQKEMREGVRAILTNLQLSPNSDAIGQQARTDAEIVPNRAVLYPGEVRAPDSLFNPTFKTLHSPSMFPWQLPAQNGSYFVLASGH